MDVPTEAENEACMMPVSPRQTTPRSSASIDEPVYTSETQRFIGEIMRRPAYEISLGLVVSFNVVLIALDVDSSVGCPEGNSCTPAYVEILDYVLLAVYTLDILAGLYVKRKDFFRDAWNYLDLTIVGFGYIELVLMTFMSSGGGLSMVRMLRIGRILRIARLLKPLPELYKLITGFVGTLRAIWYGFVMIVILLFVWAIIILQIFVTLEPEGMFGEDDQWCREAMTSTLKVGLLLWQTMVAGDSWGACAIPIILKHPAAWLVFASCYVMISLGFTNLILAVIVENATTQHEEEHLKKMEDQKKRLEKEIATFTYTFQDLDLDQDNEISMEEILAGFESVPKFRNTLIRFGITRDDLVSMFGFLDEDDSGGITYDEFVRAMFRSQRQEPGTQLMMLRLAMSKLFKRVESVDHKIGQVLEMSSSQQAISQRLSDGNQGSPTNAMPAPSTSCSVPDGAATILDTSKSAQIVSGGLQVSSFEALEQRIRATSSAVHQQSLQLAEETQMLSATLVQLGGKLKAAPSFPELRKDQSSCRTSNDPWDAKSREKLFGMGAAREEGETGQVHAKEFTDDNFSNGRALPVSTMQPCWVSHLTPRDAEELI